ncbi:MAG TPA: hypothetical protein VFO01_02505 [Trebonia sp.]|nr:hypothetical protein [Trebonia sp.]
MRSGWPTEDGWGMPPADQGNVPFGPEVSWPSGYSDLEYANGGYRYPATGAEQLPGADHGAHPYAAFNGSGYGDHGYSNSGYQGPAAQDAGISGTRTVQGFVDSGQGQQGYPPPGYARSSYLPPAPPAPHRQPGYTGPGYPAGDMDMGYPPAAGSSPGPGPYSQPWDYDRPLRYEGEEDSYVDYGRAGAPGGPENDGHYQRSAYDPAAYNGSDYSMPGINGPGYDLSGIIGTSDFEAVGYDEPSYRRLSYDDPRYDAMPRYPQPGQRFEETRFDMRRFDETRLDELWQPGDDVRREGRPAGFGTGADADSRSRSEAPVAGRGRRARAAETRFDMKALAETGAETRFDMRALAEPGDNTRFDVPRFDETRLDNLRPLTPARGLRTSGATAVAPPAAKPRNWAEDTSLDHFADLDLTDEPVPAAFTRTLERPDARPLELPPGQDDDTATRRAVGKRRGRSGDRRQWMSLGAIAVVAAGAIGLVLMKYVHVGPSGPAHTVVAPQTVDGFSRSANLEKQLNVAGEAQTVAKESSGQASGVAYGVYQMGSLTPGSNTQMFMFVGGKLTGADPTASVTNFEQHYPGAKAVQPGALGGAEACTETEVNNQSASMCVWFDNDTFGAVVSPTMTTAKLATTMNAVRPSLELYQK